MGKNYVYWIIFQLDKWTVYVFFVWYACGVLFRIVPFNDVVDIVLFITNYGIIYKNYLN